MGSRMLKHPICPCCGKQIPLHFLWSAGLHARPCPYCDKSIRLRRSKAFALAFIAVAFSWMPEQIFTGHHLWVAFIIAIALCGGFALMVDAVSAGFMEERDSTSLSL